MKHIARVLAFAGLALAVMLFTREGVGNIFTLVVAAGPGLVLAALFHVLPMIANACAWRQLLPESRRPSVRVLTWATWVRESVNGLLPVARIGGTSFGAWSWSRTSGVRLPTAATQRPAS